MVNMKIFRKFFFCNTTKLTSVFVTLPYLSFESVIETCWIWLKGLATLPPTVVRPFYKFRMSNGFALPGTVLCPPRAWMKNGKDHPLLNPPPSEGEEKHPRHGASATPAQQYNYWASGWGTTGRAVFHWSVGTKRSLTLYHRRISGSRLFPYGPPRMPDARASSRTCPSRSRRPRLRGGA